MISRRRRAAAELDAADIRSAITRLVQQREIATANAAQAMVNQAEVQQAIRRQRLELDRAGHELDAAIALAQRVAEETLRDDGAVAAEPFTHNVEGLRSQRQVVELATAQLEAVRSASSGHVQSARDLLAGTRQSLDGALHEQLRLLVALERLERARLIAQSRAGDAGG